MTTMNECTSVAGHFDGHTDALKQYRVHSPMQHDQGYTKSHWTPPLGNYLLRITPAATRATANKKMMLNVPTFLVISMAMVVRQASTMARITQWRRFMAFLKATKHHHWASTCSNCINRTCLPRIFVACFIFQIKKATR
jgi:hypothetical protein